MINNIFLIIFYERGCSKETNLEEEIVFELENIKVEKIVKSRNYETNRKGKV
jgi:hypothetical protein